MISSSVKSDIKERREKIDQERVASSLLPCPDVSSQATAKLEDAEAIKDLAQLNDEVKVKIETPFLLLLLCSSSLFSSALLLFASPHALLLVFSLILFLSSLNELFLQVRAQLRQARSLVLFADWKLGAEMVEVSSTPHPSVNLLLPLS